MKNFYTSTQPATATPAHSNFYSSFMRLPALRVLLILMILMGGRSVGWGQTVVTVGGGASITCPAVPTATWTTPPAGVTFSNWSRGSGVTCESAGNALSGSGFNTTSASASFSANKYYSVTISADATHVFSLNSVVWNGSLSSSTATFTVQYSNNGGTVSTFGNPVASSATGGTFNGTVNVAAGTSLVLYLIPSNASALSTTVRWLNGSTITVTAGGVLDPTSFNTTTSSASQINLSASANGNGDNIVLVYNGTGTFTAPTNGSAPTSVGTTLAGSGGTIVYAGTAAGLTNHTGLTANTTYYYKAFSYDGSNNYSNGLTANATTFASEPTTQASALTFSNISATGFTINATAGNGSNRIYVVRQTGPVDFVPTDGTSYTANATFTSGTGQGPSSDNKVVAVTGTSVTVTGLTANTTYYVAVYELNGSSSTINYLTTSPLAGSRLTAPTAASAVTVGTRTATSIGLSWTNGNGTGRIVLARATSNSLVAPTNGTTYTVNSTDITDVLNGTSGTGNIIVYNGTGTTTTVTGLSSGTQYQFYVYGYNGSGSTITYATAASSSATYTLAAEPIVQTTAVNFSSITATGMTVNFTKGDGGYRVVVMKSGSAVNSDPVDGTSYSTAAFGSGTQLGTGNYVVYSGTAGSAAVTGLTANTTYYLAVYEFNGTGGNTNYLLPTPATGNQITLVAAPTAPTNLAFNTITQNSFKASFTASSGSPAGYLVMRRKGAVLSGSPVGGTEYTQGSSIGAAANEIIYIGASAWSNYDQIGLDDNTTYYYAVYSYIGTGSQINYSNALSGNQTTAVIPAPTATAATVINSTGFTANWNVVVGAVSYKLDVSTSNMFSINNLSENFVGCIAGSVASPDGTDISSSLNTYLQTTGWSGSNVYQAGGLIKLGSSSNLGSITTKTIDLSANSGNATLTFDLQKYASDVATIQVFHAANGTTFSQIGSTITSPASLTTQTISITGGTVNSKIKIAASSASSNRSIVDNISVVQSQNLPSYDNLTVSGTSQNVTGLTTGTPYYYRVRAVGGNSTSANSNVITVTTLSTAPTITSFTPTSGCSTGGTAVTISGTNFTGATSVTFNGVNAASFTVTNATTISATSQAAVATGKIVVTTPGGMATSTDDFTVTDAATPTFAQLGPYCVGVTADPLQLISNNSINGTWNAAISTATAGTVTYTFTPTAGQCATTATMVILVGVVADAGPTFDYATVGNDYTFPTAIATGGDIVWTESGSGTGTFTLTNTEHPVYNPASSGQKIFTLTVTSATCGVATDVITITVLGQPYIWAGSANTGDRHDWHNSLNWIPPTNEPTSANDVLIPAEAPNFPDITGAQAFCNNITIESGASLIDNGKLTLTLGAKLTVGHPAISTGSWHFISSPVSGTTSTLFKDQYLRSFDPASNAYVEIKDLGIGLNAMQGYALWTVSSFTAPYVGGFNPTTYSPTLSLAGSGFNLIGNPYTSAIDWDAASGMDKTNVTNAIYIEKVGVWAAYVNGVGANGGSQYIAPTQGFIVKATGSGVFGMSNLAQVNEKPTFFKKSEAAVANLVRLEVSGNGYKDEAVVRFVPEATAEYDGNYDAVKFYGSVPQAAQLYTLGSKALAINSLPETDVVPVGLHVGTSGSYILTATEINDLNYVTLEDVETGIFTPLSSGSYTFNAAPGDFNNRFKLHFSMLSVQEAKKESAIVYSNQRTVHINMKDQQKGDIFIYNITGQLIKTIPSASGTNEILLPVTGNYIVKVVGKNGITVRKVWIQ